MRGACHFVWVCLMLVPAVAHAAGFGPWHLGMTRQQVEAVSDYGPYSPVRSTGGLETPKGEFMDRPVNVSFVFDQAGHLSLIQVWAYEGRDPAAAVEAFHRAYNFLLDQHGAVHQEGDPWPSGLSEEEFSGRIPVEFKQRSKGLTMEELKARGSVRTTAIPLHLHPREPVEGANVYGSLIKNPQLGLYWVFLFVRAP